MVISFKLVLILIFFILYNFIFISHNKWYNVIGLMIILLTFAPADAVGIVSNISYNTSGYLNVSLLCYDVLIAFFISLIFKRKPINHIDKRVYLSFVVFFLVMFIIRICANGIGFLSNKIFDNFLTPILFAIIVIRYLTIEDVKKILNLFLICVMINSILATFEYFYGKSLFFHNYYIENISWYQNIYNSTVYGIKFRSTSFLGHPLINATYYLSATLLLLYNDKIHFIKKFILLLILLFAIFSTNSRAALLITIISISYYLFKNKKYILLFILMSIGLILFFSIDMSEIYSSVFARDSSGSSMNVRFEAIKKFLKLPYTSILFGVGFNNSSAYLRNFGFQTNLEISYFIIILENGIFVFTLWLIMLMTLFGKKYRGKSNKLITTLKSVIIMLLMIFATYNSIADPGTLNYLLFGFIALYNVVKSTYTYKENGGKTNGYHLAY